jgi:hypothetical protein
MASAFLYAHRRYDTDPAAKLLIVLTRTIPPAQAAQKGLSWKI